MSEHHEWNVTFALPGAWGEGTGTATASLSAPCPCTGYTRLLQPLQWRGAQTEPSAACGPKRSETLLFFPRYI